MRKTFRTVWNDLDSTFQSGWVVRGAPRNQGGAMEAYIAGIHDPALKIDMCCGARTLKMSLTLEAAHALHQTLSNLLKDYDA